MNLDISYLNDFLSFFSNKIPQHISPNYKCCHLTRDDLLNNRFSTKQLTSLTSNNLHIDSISTLIDQQLHTSIDQSFLKDFHDTHIYYRQHSIKLYIGDFQEFIVFEIINIFDKSLSPDCKSTLNYLFDTQQKWLSFDGNVDTFFSQHNLFTINPYSSFVCDDNKTFHYNIALSLIGTNYIINIPDVHNTLEDFDLQSQFTIYNLSLNDTYFFSRDISFKPNCTDFHQCFHDNIFDIHKLLFLQGYKPYLFLNNIYPHFQSYCHNTNCKMIKSENNRFLSYAIATAELVDTTSDIYSAMSSSDKFIKLHQISKILFMELLFFITQDIIFDFNFSTLQPNEYIKIEQFANILFPLLSFSTNPVDYVNFENHLINFEKDFLDLVTSFNENTYDDLIKNLFESILNIFNMDRLLLKKTLFFIYPKIFY